MTKTDMTYTQKEEASKLLQQALDAVDYLARFSVENRDVFNEEVSSINDTLFEIEKKCRV